MKNIMRPALVVMGLLVVAFTIYGCSTREEKRDRFMEKGVRLYETGEYKKAVLEFSNAIQLDPKFAPGYLYLGKTFIKDGNINKAYGGLSKAVDLDKDLDEARLELGMVLVMAKEGEKALSVIQPLIEKDPDNVKACLISAQANLLLGKPDETIAQLDRIPTGKRNEDVLQAYANAYFLKKDNEKFEEYLLAYQKAAPGVPSS